MWRASRGFPAGFAELAAAVGSTPVVGGTGGAVAEEAADSVCGG